MPQKYFLFFLIADVLLNVGFAFGAGFDALTNNPATDAQSYFSVWSPKTLKSGDWEVGSSVQFLYRPLQLYQNGARVRSVIDSLGVQHFTGSVGVIDKWLQLGVDLPVAWGYTFTNPNILAATQETRMSLGDVQFHLKSSVYNSPSDRVRLGLLSTVSAPTGDNDHFLGSSNATFSEKALLEIVPAEKLSVGLNAGINIRPDFVFRDLDSGHQLLLGLGVQYTFNPRLQLLAEIDHQTRLKNLYNKKVEAPIEAVIGVKYLFKDTGLLLNSGVGVGLIYGSGTPLTRVFAGLSYSPSLKKRPKLDGEGESGLQPTIYFPLNSAGLRRVQKQVLDHTVELLKKHPTVHLILVQGYTDSRGPDHFNRQLSLSRARRTKRYLVSRGIDAGRIDIEGHGETRPVVSNKTREERQKNRRVEIKIKRTGK